MVEQRFKVGDCVTYISHDEAAAMKLRDDSLVKYFYGGDDQAGFIGTIKHYMSWVPKHQCWNIKVTTRSGYTYAMLECEFREYSQAVNDKHYEIY